MELLLRVTTNQIRYRIHHYENSSRLSEEINHMNSRKKERKKMSMGFGSVSAVFGKRRNTEWQWDNSHFNKFLTFKPNVPSCLSLLLLWKPSVPTDLVTPLRPKLTPDHQEPLSDMIMYGGSVLWGTGNRFVCISSVWCGLKEGCSETNMAPSPAFIHLHMLSRVSHTSDSYMVLEQSVDFSCSIASKLTMIGWWHNITSINNTVIN